MVRTSFGLVLVLALVTVPAWSFDRADDPLTPLQATIHQLIAASWQATDEALTASHDVAGPDRDAAAETDRLVRDLGRRLTDALEAGNRQPLEAFRDEYLALDPAGRAALFPVLDQVRASQLQALRPAVSETQMREYFPGYGHTEYGYKYRKGREVSREHKGFRWQSEEQTINMNLNQELVINLDLLSIFQGLAQSGAIKDLKVGEPYQMTTGGAPFFVCKISFTANKTLVTKTNRKYEVSKVWFELWRAKGIIWTTGDWELVGQTYVIMQEPTGDDVVTGVNRVLDQPLQVGQPAFAKVEP
jgi:hypothetical protein